MTRTGEQREPLTPYGLVENRVGTRRNPHNRTKGAEVALLIDATGRPLLPWQRHALDVGLEVVTTPGSSQGQRPRGPDGRWVSADRAGTWRWRYSDVGVLVARQNGKSEGVLEPRIIGGLVLWGEQILHLAQNRALPRESFLRVADLMETHFSDQVKQIRYANGQEVIRTINGGTYRTLAPRPAAPRGFHADLLIIDEVREFSDTEVMASLLPTTNTSKNPQVWYASNAGDPDSVVLNGLRERALAVDEEGNLNPDYDLAWLEWSADPALDDDDPLAWAQANPSMGTLIDLNRIERLHSVLTAEEFATEQLCRWVEVSGSRAIPAPLWKGAIVPVAELPGPAEDRRPVVSIDVDVDRQAAAVAAAWHLDSGHIGTDLVLYRTGDLGDLEGDVTKLLRELVPSPSVVGYDPWTTEHLADVLAHAGVVTTPVTGRSWVSACQNLLEVLQGDRLRHPGREVLTSQMAQAPRRESAEGRWWIARGSEPIPAVTATARAVYLVSKPRAVYKIY